MTVVGRVFIFLAFGLVVAAIMLTKLLFESAFESSQPFWLRVFWGLIIIAVSSVSLYALFQWYDGD